MTKVFNIRQFFKVLDIENKETFVPCGYPNGDPKVRIGNTLHTYDEVKFKIEMQQCQRVGLWIPKGYIVVDCDTLESAEKVTKFLDSNNIETVVFKTKKGKHFFFKTDEQLSQVVNGETQLGAFVDYRVSEKGYIILPINDIDRGILNIVDDIPELPFELTVKPKLATKVRSVKENGPKNDLKPIVGRNDNLMRHLSGVINYNVFRDYNMLLTYALGYNAQYEQPLEYNEVVKVVKSVYGRYTPPTFLDDKGRIEPLELAKTLVDEFNYIHYRKSSFSYKDGYYHKYLENEHLNAEVIKYVQNTTDSKITVKTLNDTVAFMKNLNTKAVQKSEYISVKNGLVSLKDFSIIPHSSEHITFFQVPCTLESTEKALERFEGSSLSKYLTTTFKGDRELINAVQEILGMSLMPNPKKYQKAVILNGGGSNGKSLFINLLKALHGNVVSSVPFKSLDGSSGQNFDLYNMLGVNVNIDADASGTRLTETSNFKKLTSGDNVQLTKKGEQGVSGELDILLLMCMNELPSTADKSDGFFRRCDIIPFNQKFAKAEQCIDRGDVLPIDVTLEDTIINEEMDILLAFALKGLERVRERGYKLSPCKAIENAVTEYQLENDSVLAFYEDTKEGEIIPLLGGNAYYQIYLQWCERSNLAPVTTHSFGKAMKKRYKSKISNGVKYIDVPIPKSFSSLIENK